MAYQPLDHGRGVLVEVVLPVGEASAQVSGQAKYAGDQQTVALGHSSAAAGNEYPGEREDRHAHAEPAVPE